MLLKGKRSWAAGAVLFAGCAALAFAWSSTHSRAAASVRPDSARAVAAQPRAASGESKRTSTTQKKHSTRVNQGVTPASHAVTSNQSSDVVPESATAGASPEVIQQAKQELERLKVQQPLAFLSAFLPSDDRLVPRSQVSAVTSARSASAKYLDERSSLLQTMIANYIASDGTYDFQSDLDRLAENDAYFRNLMAPVAKVFPQIVDLPDVMGSTALPLPTFARAPASEPAQPEDNLN